MADSLSIPSLSVASIMELIEQKVLPWVEEWGMSRAAIAQPTLKTLQASDRKLPSGMEAVSSPLQGRRVPVRERSLGFQLLSARWPKDGLDAKTGHNIACILRGVADLKIGDYCLRCPEGHFIFLAAGVPYADGSRVHLEGEHLQNRSCDIMWFSTSGDEVKCWVCRSEGERHSGMPAFYISRKNLPINFDSLFLQALEGGPTQDKIRQGLLLVLLASILHEIQQGRFFRWLPQTTNLTETEQADPIARAQDYIRRHLSEPLTLERVAHLVFMSRSQFARKFHAQTGETFNVFLTRCRLEEAKPHLTTTSVEIAALGRYVGLKPRRFTQIFLENTGLTPSAYRARYSVRDKNLT